MTAFDDALARLGGNYYNVNPKTPTNPGGLGGYGHTTSMFGLKTDLAVVAGYIKPAVDQIRGVALTAAAAQTSADDARASFNATKAKAEFFASLTPAEIWAWENATKFFSASAMLAASKSQPLAFATPLVLDGLAGFNRHTTVLSHFTLANPVNLKPGTGGRIRFQMGGAGGYTMAVGSAWKLALGIDDLSTAVGAIDTLSYYVHDAAYIEATLSPGFV